MSFLRQGAFGLQARSGKGNGREYYINIISRDESWNYSFQQVVVKVPHDNRSSNENTIKPDETFINLNKESPQFKIMAWPNPSTKSFNLIVYFVEKMFILILLYIPLN